MGMWINPSVPGCEYRSPTTGADMTTPSTGQPPPEQEQEYPGRTAEMDPRQQLYVFATSAVRDSASAAAGVRFCSLSGPSGP
jgi:hypothetical protein